MRLDKTSYELRVFGATQAALKECTTCDQDHEDHETRSGVNRSEIMLRGGPGTFLQTYII